MTQLVFTDAALPIKQSSVMKAEKARPAKKAVLKNKGKVRQFDYFVKVFPYNVHCLLFLKCYFMCNVAQHLILQTQRLTRLHHVIQTTETRVKVNSQGPVSRI